MTDRLTIRRLRRHRARCGKPRPAITPPGWGSLALYVVDAEDGCSSIPHVLGHIWPLPECRRRAALIGGSSLVIGETVFRWRAEVIPW